ncbi:hypothetical protein B0H14DRAFT_2614998 [Mycena olivaceomarginata]|nr:hypothetical protein B0H14DRAFT_2614998 [Mycena olivaceomarginata]
MFLPNNENRDVERSTESNGKLAKGTQEITDRNRVKLRLVPPSLSRTEDRRSPVQKYVREERSDARVSSGVRGLTRSRTAIQGLIESKTTAKGLDDSQSFGRALDLSEEGCSALCG